MNELSPSWTTPQPFKLRIEDFEVLIESGAFEAHPKVELIEGELLAMSPQHVPHARAKTEIGFHLREALATMQTHLAMLIEVTVAIPPDTAPEPDIVLTSSPNDKSLATVASIPLVVEVSASTLDYDLKRKAAIYASAGIGEYWIADLEGRQFIRLTAPSPEGYADRVDIPFGEPIASATIPGLTIDTGGL